MIRAWFHLLVVDVTLRLRPFPRVQKAAAKLRPRARSDGESAENVIVRAKSAVSRAASFHPARPRCLQRSLTLQRLLADEGLATELKIGVRKEGAAIEAHAWVEWEGRPLGEPENVGTRFAPIVAGGNQGRER